MNKILEKIDMDKEVLSAMPKNNKKNISKYIQYVQELKKEYETIENDINDEMTKRYKKILAVKKNKEIDIEKREIDEISNLLDIIGTTKTSYEKMGIDKKIYKLGRFYKENLENINIEILECIKKFKEVGIDLTSEDFDYSIYVHEYMNTFFDELDHINSKVVKNKFEEIYWKCPDLIIHIELNLRYIYIKNQKNIDKYYENRKNELLKNIDIETDKIEEKYNNLQKQYEEEKCMDNYLLIHNFLDGKLNSKDYEPDKIKDEYLKLIPQESLDDTSEKNVEEINQNSIKFLNSLCEYKNYLKFQYIFEDIKKKYQEREQYKDAYNTTKKEINAKEKKLEKLNNKINGKGLFSKMDKKEQQIAEYNSIILEIKELYKKLDNNKIYTKIIDCLSDNSTIYDVLKFASQFNNYLVDCIIANNSTITQEEIEKLILELKDFLNDPYNIIIKNITMLEEKNIAIMISDRYKLLNFAIEKEDITPDNLDNLIDTLQKIKNYYYIQKSGINLEEMEFICEFKKLANIK